MLETKDAINRFIQVVTAAQEIDWARMSRAEVQGIALPEGVTIHDFEPFFEARRRFRGTFLTKSVDSFVSYLEGTSGATCFIDQDRMAALSILDLGTEDAPGHCDHRAILTLDPTPIYAAVKEINGKPMDQRGLAEWMEDWKNFLSVDKGPIRAAIAAVRCIDIKAKAEVTTTVGNMSETQSKFASVEATSRHTLPETISVMCKPYGCLGTRIVELMLSVITGDRPVLKLRIVGRGEMEEAIAQEFGELLASRLPEGHVALLGRFEAKP